MICRFYFFSPKKKTNGEGDGYLGTFEGKLMFVLTQKESKILYHIRDTLKFGQVREFEGFYRYIVSAQS